MTQTKIIENESLNELTPISRNKSQNRVSFLDALKDFKQI